MDKNLNTQDYGNIIENINVPMVVVNEIRQFVSRLLEKSGVYYRLFTRVKSDDSLMHKLNSGKYGKGKRIQDLIGMRIVLYFEDDLGICKDILESEFGKVEWSETEVNHNNFGPQKINGVIKLPRYLSDKIKGIDNNYIDSTFEVQIKTTLFEGWHEIEHDLRYKNSEIWDAYKSYSRKLNSVLATLELCDGSVVSMLDDFAHQLYKDEKWDEMIRMHFRLKIDSEPLCNELRAVFVRNAEIAKKVLKYRKSKLVNALMQRNYYEKININEIIFLIKDELIEGNDEIALIEKNYRKTSVTQKHNYKTRELKPLSNKYKVFEVKGKIDYTTGTFEVVTKCLYEWAYKKFKVVFGDICLKTANYLEYGYKLEMIYDSEKEYFMMKCAHLADETPGRVWETYVEIDRTTDFYNLHIYNQIIDRDTLSIEQKLHGFSYPGFYRSIVDNNKIIVRDIIDVGRDNYVLDNYQKFKALIISKERSLPVVLILNDNVEKEYNEWTGRFSRRVTKYCHVYKCNDREIYSRLLKEMTNNFENIDIDEFGVILFEYNDSFGGDEKIIGKLFTSEEIDNFSYQWYAVSKNKYNLQNGLDAFASFLADEIKKTFLYKIEKE